MNAGPSICMHVVEAHSRPSCAFSAVRATRRGAVDYSPSGCGRNKSVSDTCVPVRSVSYPPIRPSARTNAGLRAVALVNESKALEAYFIRNGASWQPASRK